jgi:dsRNA-specific ribonuclease
MTEEFINQKILGIRGAPFKQFIQSLLTRMNLSQKNIDILTNTDNIRFYEHAFTHKSIDEHNNYEFYEFLGDVTCNKIIVWYLKNRFPFLNNTKGVKVLARLKINYVSKKTFYGWSLELGFEKYISYDLETKMKYDMDILEDCLEAFVGVSELLIDKIFNGSGYFFCYRFLTSILDKEYISLKYNDLYDPITRLKETFDYFNSLTMKNSCPFIWGTIRFEPRKLEEGGQHVRLIQKLASREETLLEDEGLSLSDTKYRLSQNYLDFLKKSGFEKPLPDYYKNIEFEQIKLLN